MKFCELHPTVSLLYFAAGLCLVMFTQNPILLLFALTFTLIFAAMDGRFAKTLRFIGSCTPLLLAVFIITPLFSHRGNTALFMLPSGNAFTLESVIYSAANAIMLLCVLLMFKAYAPLLSSDNIYAVLGKISPHMALYFTAALRFFPKITRSFRAAYSIKCAKTDKFTDKIKAVGACMLSCVSLSLEDSLKTAQSMKARGYGTGKRSFYIEKRFRTADYTFLLFELIILIMLIFALCGGALRCTFYPRFSIDFSVTSSIGYILYAFYFAAADIFELFGGIMCKAYR